MTEDAYVPQDAAARAADWDAQLLESYRFHDSCGGWAVRLCSLVVAEANREASLSAFCSLALSKAACLLGHVCDGRTIRQSLIVDAGCFDAEAPWQHVRDRGLSSCGDDLYGRQKL